MTEPLDPNRTVEDAPSTPPDSLDPGLAAGFGRPADGPGSALEKLRSSLGLLQPVLLSEAEGESPHVVKPKSDALPAPEQTGTRYQLQGEIARGGMGAVLRGRDVDLGRDLAVKVLLEKYADRPEVVRRFVEEAQIGGQLQHPGVVPVYDIGHFGDRPFFTMKLVKGQTLAALLSERQEPSEALPHLLNIALKVTQALAYAHSKGVIHRDLKPANIMVGAFGEVQVMDWGLAKVLPQDGSADEEKASRERQRPEDGTVIRTSRSGSSGSGMDTEAGSLLGTPAYMPPEQANGDVAMLDRRADVFGLGAILCEILTGQPPYVGRSFEEVRRKAANGDLADAHARLQGCGADTELLALTRACLAAEAIDRPKDAQAVADALTAYLEGVQVRLRQAELAEAEAKARALEEAKRRRLTLVLAATVLLTLTLGGSGWLWLQTDRSARQTRVTRQVHDALNRVTALREQARAATLGDAVLFAQAREHLQRALALVENGPADAALAAQVRQLQMDLDDEEKDRQLVAALEKATLAQAEHFFQQRAVPVFRETFRAYGLPVAEMEPAAAAERIRQRPALVREVIFAALDEWDDIAGKPMSEVAEPERKWLRAVLEAAEPEDALGRQVRAAQTEKDKARRQAALQRLAASADVARVPARALTRLARKLDPAPKEALLRRAQAQYPADFWVNEELGWLLRGMKPPRSDEAVRFLTAAVALRPESPAAHDNLGIALIGKGQADEAIACHTKAIELDPNFAKPHNHLGYVLANLKGDSPGAIACYKKAIALDPNFAQPHSNLGFEYRRKRQWDEAIACYQKVIAIDPKDSYGHSDLASALHGKGEVDQAIACWRKSISLHSRNAPAHNNLGDALYRKGELDEAIACWRKCILLDPKIAQAHSNLGTALRDKGRLGEAIACYQKAVEVNPQYDGARRLLAVTLLSAGRIREAIPHLETASVANPKDTVLSFRVAVLQAWFGQNKELAATLERIRAFARDTNDAGTAQRAARACSIRPSTNKAELETALALARKGVELAKTGPERDWSLLALGMAEYRSGNDAAALEALRAAVKAGPNNRRLADIAVFYQEMSLFRQGKRDEASKLALAATAQMKPVPKDERKLLAGGTDQNDLILWLAWKEAKVLLQFDATRGELEP